ncbi:MAG: chemotaxis protein CheA, partial [Candidatus Kapaibacteriota bacterium]
MFNDPEMQEIFEAFIVESTELLENLSQDLMLIEETPEDEELLNRIFRAFHTIKGTSSFMGFDKIATLTHHAEDILNKLRRFELKANQQIIDVLLEVYDHLQLMIQRVKNGEDISDVDYSTTIEKINILKSGGTLETLGAQVLPSTLEESLGTDKEGSKVEQVLQLAPDILSKPGDFSPEELELINAAFEEVNKSVMSETKTLELGSIENFKDTLTNVTESTKTEETFIETKPPADIVEQAPKAKEREQVKSVSPSISSAETIRIDVSRLENLMNLSGELVLGRNRLEQITRNLLSGELTKDNLKELEETTSQIDFITSEIQASVMRMRMIPIGKLFQKAPRIIRDLAKQFGKKIQLIMEGEDTEIDKGIIDELSDPLVHMLRNACDHGIETPEERLKLG